MREMRVAFALLTLLLCAATTYAQEQRPATKREAKIQERIDKLSGELLKYKSELADEQLRRGVDATTVAAIETKIVPSEGAEVAEVAEGSKDSDKTYAIQENPTIRFSPLQMDSLLNIWKERESQENFDNFFSRYVEIDEEAELAALEAAKGNKKAIATALDSLYVKRLNTLASPIEMSYNYIVKSYISRYTSPKSNLMSILLARSKYYFPIIEEELIKNDLPVELRNMATIESALVSGAVSRAGAMGLWQFMPSTGKHYNLEINYLVDERCDPVKSTVAACKFLRDLYDMFGDWTLAIAAYNCGPGNVNKALARSGLKEGTFWDIYYFLPSETRGYVPAFIGATYGYSFHKQHNIEPSIPPMPLATDTVTVNRILHLGQVAETLDLPIDVIRELNPQYRRDIIPATTKSYSLRLPQRYVGRYITNEESIHAKDTQYLKQYINPANVERLKKMPTGTIYVVKSGDTISGIAKKYGTTTRKIMALNNLHSAHKISIGQKLRVR